MGEQPKHTPGSWRVEIEDEQPIEPVIVIDDGYAEDGEVIRYYIATCHGGLGDYYQPGTDDQALANAHLISAAPDMLALLKLSLGDAEHVLCHKFWDDVRSAIAKAEGRIS